MESWMEFEDECLHYLQNKYGLKGKFTATGKSDCTHSDIFVETSRSNFYIEVKKANAQSGQFVVLPDCTKNKFIFSPKNKTAEDEFTKIIIEFMNDDFTGFNTVGTAGKAVVIDENIFYSWIVKSYRTKGVKYFMTKGDDYIIVPISKFENYFSVSAKYRIKRSGSAKPSAKHQIEIIETLKNEYKISNYSVEAERLFVFGDACLNKARFTVGDKKYYLVKKEMGKYEVRRLSDAQNKNVIFTIALKAKQDMEDLATFERELN